MVRYSRVLPTYANTYRTDIGIVIDIVYPQHFVDIFSVFICQILVAFLMHVFLDVSKSDVMRKDFP